MIGTIAVSPSIDEHLIIDRLVKAERDGREYHFCSLKCRRQFLKEAR